MEIQEAEKQLRNIEISLNRVINQIRGSCIETDSKRQMVDDLNEIAFEVHHLTITNTDWKCQSCGKLINHDPKGTAAICIKCGGTSELATKDWNKLVLGTDEKRVEEIAKKLGLLYRDVVAALREKWGMPSEQDEAINKVCNKYARQLLPLLHPELTAKGE